MKLRFKLNQAEAFRRGIDAPKSIIHLEVNPREVPEPFRTLVADRMFGIDVCQKYPDGLLPEAAGSLVLIETNTPDWAGLCEAIIKDEDRKP